jgi:hypothetical protein
MRALVVLHAAAVGTRQTEHGPDGSYRPTILHGLLQDVEQDEGGYEKQSGLHVEIVYLHTDRRGRKQADDCGGDGATTYRTRSESRAEFSCSLRSGTYPERFQRVRYKRSESQIMYPGIEP